MRAARSSRSATRNATSIAGETFSSYSTSASASAERQSRHQCTGFALVEVSVADDAAEGAQLLRLVARRHGEVGSVPVAEDTEPLEVSALQIDLLVRIGAAGGAKGLRVELLAGPAVLFLHLQLDRQPVAIPPRDVG